MYDETVLREWFDVNLATNEWLGLENNAGYEGVTFQYEVSTLVDVMAGRDPYGDIEAAPIEGIDALGFEPYCDYDGIIQGFNMTILAEDIRLDVPLVLGPRVKYLMQSMGWQELTYDREIKGVEAAWAIVLAVAEAWDDLYRADDRLRAALDLYTEFKGLLAPFASEKEKPHGN